MTVFHRDCGATTAEVTLVTLHDPTKKYDDGKNAVLISKGLNAVDVSWESDMKVRVYCRTCRPDLISLQIAKFAGVTIDYEP